MGTHAQSNQSLQQAWESAQPKLASTRSSTDTNPSPKSRILRVGQLDSELLDRDLLDVLKEPLNKAISLINASFKTRFEPEFTLLVQLTLYKFAMWNHGASYGAGLQDLKYVAKSAGDYSVAPSGLPRRTLLIHGTLTIIMPYLHARLRSHALSHAWPDAPSSDRRRKAWDVLSSLEGSYTIVVLLNFLVFLWDGRYHSIVDRILNICLEQSRRTVKRDISYEFMNRQMVWHAFTEFLLFLVPLIPARFIRGRPSRLMSWDTLTSAASHIPTPLASILHISSKQGGKQPQHSTKRRGAYWSLPLDQCAICVENTSFGVEIASPAFAAPSSTPTSPVQENAADEDVQPPACPIYTPYRASCGDIYCYHCIAECMMRVADEGLSPWKCLRCGEEVRHAERFVVDTAGSADDGSECSDAKVTDMSTSIGSFSDSIMSD